MTIAEHHIQDRIKWIMEDSNLIRNGEIRTHVYDTTLKASRFSQFAAEQVPLLKANVTAEKILFVDFPVKSNYVDRLYIAQPMYTGITGLGCKDYPVQVACLTDYKLPNSVATFREKRKKFVFVSNEGADDLFIKQIFKDGKLTEISWSFMNIVNKDERIALQYGLQIIPPIDVFSNRTLCTLSSGTRRKTMGAYGRRIYDFDNYLQWLENTVRNLKELNYAGPVKDTGVYDSIYFIFHEGLANLNTLKSSWICPKCGKSNEGGFKFCSSCGFENKKSDDNWVCPKCGKSNEGGFKFCSSCGFENKKEIK